LMVIGDTVLSLNLRIAQKFNDVNEKISQ